MIPVDRGQQFSECEIGLDVEITGFSLAEIDLTIEQADQSRTDTRDEEADTIPPVGTTAVTRRSTPLP